MVLALLREVAEAERCGVSACPTAGNDLAAIVGLRPDPIDLAPRTVDADWSVRGCSGAVGEARARGADRAELGIGVVHQPFDIDHLLGAIAEAWDTPPAAGAGCSARR